MPIEPDENKLDTLREKGYRPEVVGCFLNGKKVFMFYDMKFRLWQFPQGGIELDESPSDAFWREMREELGNNFCTMATGDPKIFFETSLSFSYPPANKKITLKSGKDVPLSGKWYFCYLIQTETDNFDLQDSQFDDFCLCDTLKSLKLADMIYQTGKQKITKEIILALNNNNLIA